MAYADQYVVYDYWVAGYCVGDVTATEAAGSVNGIGTVTGLGNAVFSANGLLIGIGTVDANGNAVFSGNSSITGIASIIAIGYRIGEEWSNSSVGANTWMDASVTSNTWTDKTTGSNTWLPQ
jgi:hypothetical protein